MLLIAVRMLVGDVAKYLGLILGIAFSTLLIAQQSSIFWGAMSQTTHAVDDVHPMADIWVMRPTVETPEDPDPMQEAMVKRVASVEGVAWAVPYYKGAAQLRTADGRRRQVMILGADDGTLLGAPPNMIIGTSDELRRHDGVIVDLAAYRKIFPGEPVRVGATFEVGQRRATVVGVCRASTPFNGLDVIFARRSFAVAMAREAENTVSFVLARAADGVESVIVADRIRAATGLRAEPREAFRRKTVEWFLANSGITEVLGTAIVLGLVVGVVIVGQTFYMFSVENVRQFATLKAIGLSNGRVLMMLAVQAFFVAGVGYGIGIGLTAVAFQLMTSGDASPLRGMSIPIQVAIGTGVAVLLMTMASALLSARRVLTVDPAIVFRN